MTARRSRDCWGHCAHGSAISSSWVADAKRLVFQKWLDDRRPVLYLPSGSATLRGGSSESGPDG